LPDTSHGKAKFDAERIYIGADPANPMVGDARVRFEIVPAGPVSIIARQMGKSFTSFHSPHGDTEMLNDGLLTADRMFTIAKERNAMLTWGIRLGGLLGTWIGLMLMIGPLRVMADFLPFLGNLVGAATGIIALLISAMISFIVIAIAWLFYRPLIGIGCLALAAGMVWLIRRAHQKSKPMQSIPAIPPPIPS
jgi:hypothetical protein